MNHTYDLLIIGAGQAGLAAGYFAQQKGLNYLIVDAADSVAASWQNRYDSLTLFTPRAYSSLPEFDFPGDPEGCPAKDEVADYLKGYALRFNLAIALKTEVTHLTKQADMFTLNTRGKKYTAKAVIVATGPFHSPAIPDWSKPAKGVMQLHSSEYKNPSQIKGRRVLIVGGGSSGAQIAEELAYSFDVTLSVATKLRFMPNKFLGKSIFWWLEKTGILHSPKGSVQAKLLAKRPDPLFATKLRYLLKNNIVHQRVAVRDMHETAIVFLDGSQGIFDTIIWCTGYKQDYGFVDIPDAFDDKGLPQQIDGLSTTVEGLGYIGLPWLRSRGSSLLGGVGADAKIVVEKIV